MPLAERWWFDGNKLAALLKEEESRPDVGVALLALEESAGVSLSSIMKESPPEEESLSPEAQELYW
jgi:hypothetical protein